MKKLLLSLRLSPTVQAGFFIATLLAVFGFAHKKQAARTCGKVSVEIATPSGIHFVSSADVLGALRPPTGPAEASPASPDSLYGSRLSALDLRQLERQVLRNPFVKQVSLSADLAGRITVAVDQVQPLARVFRPTTDGYLGAEGQLLPPSKNYTARVLVIDASRSNAYNFATLTETEGGRQLLALVKTISADPFWQALIAQINVMPNGYLELQPQVGQQNILFGPPEGYALKLSKLQSFYTQIVPKRGWTRYKRVILQYDQQIICE
jgi:cell division protein FtsQ